MTNQPMSALQGLPPGLTWGIKHSFMRYLSSIDDTRIALDDGASMLDVGAFNFTYSGSKVDSATGSGSFEFRGTVELSAHSGMLAVILRNPRVDIADTSASLSIDGPSGVITDRLMLCALEGGTYEALGSDLVWLADHVYLTEAGAAIFGGQYAPGQELDPIRMRITL